MAKYSKKQSLRQQLNAFDEQQSLNGYNVVQQADPSVERLLEGFCYITRQIEEFLNTSSPDFVLHLLNVLWPTSLRDIPAMSVVQFNKINYPIFLKTEALLINVTEDNKHIKFSTMVDATILPLGIESVNMNRDCISLNMLFQDSCDLSHLDKILLYVDPEADDFYNLSFLLFKRLRTMRLKVGNQDISLPAECFPVSFHKNIDDPFELINHFFQCPRQFLFFEIQGISRYLSAACKRFSLRFEFQEILKSSQDVLPLFHLNCVPVSNVFSQACEPLLVCQQQDCYELSADDQHETSMLEVTQLQAKTLTGAIVNLLNPYLGVQQCEGVHYVLHKLKNEFQLLIDVNHLQESLVLSVQALVHQPALCKGFYWKNAKLTTVTGHLKGQFFDKLSLPIENVCRDGSALLAVLQRKITPQSSKQELQCLLNTLLCQHSAKHLRMIAGIVTFTNKAVFQLQLGVVKEVVIWEIHLSRENFETLASLYHFALVLERLIDLYRPANTYYKYIISMVGDEL